MKPALKASPAPVRVDHRHCLGRLVKQWPTGFHPGAVTAGLERNDGKRLRQHGDRRNGIILAGDRGRLFHVGQENIDARAAVEQFGLVDQRFVPARIERHGQAPRLGAADQVGDLVQRGVFGDVEMAGRAPGERIVPRSSAAPNRRGATGRRGRCRSPRRPSPAGRRRRLLEKAHIDIGAAQLRLDATRQRVGAEPRHQRHLAPAWAIWAAAMKAPPPAAIFMSLAKTSRPSPGNASRPVKMRSQ